MRATMTAMSGRYLYQEHHRCFVTCSTNVETVVAEECIELGAEAAEPVFRGVKVTASPAVLYRMAYCARTPSRILVPLIRFGCHTDKVLYRKAQQIRWSDFLSVDSTFAVFATVSGSRITHSKYAALRLKDAIVDWFRDRTGRRPSVDTREPDLWVGLHVEDNVATISIDAGGGPLHRRGYRTVATEAPLQEALAAAIVRLSGWQGERPLVDPMCGSGTLLAESLMAWCRIPAGFLRKQWGFQRLPDFDEPLWRQVKQACDNRIRPARPGWIRGSDIDRHAVSAALDNLSRIPGGDAVTIRRADFRSLDNIRDAVIITNPPYGVRLGEQREAEVLIRQFGDFLKKRCTGTTAWVLCGSTALVKHIGLRTSRRIPLSNGPLDTRLVRLDLY